MLSPPPCADPGRALFFEQIGQYFSLPPKTPPLPGGTACGICGAVTAPVWPNSTRTLAVCQAQQVITRKRAARAAPEEPCSPDPGRQGMASFGEGSMVVAGPGVQRVWTRVLPDRPLPATIDVIFPRPGSLVKAVRDLVEQPPPGPFVAIVFGKQAAFQTRITRDAWLAIVEAAQWSMPGDIKQAHPKASILKAGRVVFNIKANDYRLVAVVQYKAGVLIIRFFGSHAGYDKIDAETV